MLRSSVVLTVSLMAGGLAFTALTLVPGTVHAAKEEAAPEKPRKLTPKVQKALKAAQDAMQKEDWATAAAKVQEAEAVEKRNEFDEYQIDEFRAVVAVHNNDLAAAAAAFERMLVAGYMTPEQELERVGHVARIHSRLEHYDKAIEFSKRWQEAAGGTNLDAQLILADSYYRTDNFDGALTEMQKALQLAEAQGQPAKEPWLQILLHSYAQKEDEANVVATLKKLVQQFPKQEYWRQLMGTLHGGGEADDRVMLNTYRLMHELGVLPGPDDYVEMAELANEQGLPGEAVKVMEEGFANKMLEKGKDIDRRKSRLQEFKATANGDRKQLATDEKEAIKAKQGEPDVAIGIAYLSYDQYDKAVEALQRGIQKGGVKRPDEAQIMLGRALLKLNRKDEAIKAFAAVPESSKLGQLAQLWAIHAGHQSAAAGA